MFEEIRKNLQSQFENWPVNDRMCLLDYFNELIVQEYDESSPMPVKKNGRREFRTLEGKYKNDPDLVNNPRKAGAAKSWAELIDRIPEEIKPKIEAVIEILNTTDDVVTYKRALNKLKYFFADGPYYKDPNFNHELLEI